MVSEKALVSYKQELVDDDFVVEYEVVPVFSPSDLQSSLKNEICNAISDLDKRIDFIDNEVAKLNSEIERYTNNADWLDYTVAVSSGVLCGMIDSFFVGETEINKEKIQKFLEEKYHTAHDSGYKHKTEGDHWIDSAMFHRLDDLAHHPTLLGLVASILSRYLRLVIFIDGTDGKPHIFFSDTSSGNTKKRELKDLMKAWVGAIIGGICLWLVHVAEKKYEEINDEKMPKPLKKIVKAIGTMPMIIEVLKAVDVWVGHMMSDVSTSQGIPGIFLSLLKELSVLPILRNTNFRVYVDSLYRKGEQNLNEWGGVVFTAAKKQAIPVLINETITRSFYFVRHLIEEYKAHNDWKSVNWENVISFKNRTIVRMLTISTGTFTTIDLADAAIRSAVKNAGQVASPTFWKDFILRVNFVGIGRLAIAIGTDVGMGMKKSALENKRMVLMSEQIELLNARVFYYQENMWLQIDATEQSLEDLEKYIDYSANVFSDSYSDIEKSIENIGKYIPEMEKKNPGLKQQLLDAMW